MTLAQLIEVITPPATPFEAFNGPWETVEAELGTALPKDYKEFVRVYGAGQMMGFFGIDVPRSANINTRLEVQARLVGDIFRTMYDDDEDAPYWFWPERKGLLPFGSTDNGDYLFWHMLGEPDEWRVVVWERGLQEFEALDCGLVEFLLQLATGKFIPDAFYDDHEPVFRPNSDFPVKPTEGDITS